MMGYIVAATISIKFVIPFSKTEILVTFYDKHFTKGMSNFQGKPQHPHVPDITKNSFDNFPP